MLGYLSKFMFHLALTPDFRGLGLCITPPFACVHLVVLIPSRVLQHSVVSRLSEFVSKTKEMRLSICFYALFTIIPSLDLVKQEIY